MALGLQVDVSPEDFAKYAGSQLDGNSHAKKLLLDELSSISDFLVFKKMMVSRICFLRFWSDPRVHSGRVALSFSIDSNFTPLHQFGDYLFVKIVARSMRRMMLKSDAASSSPKEWIE